MDFSKFHPEGVVAPPGFHGTWVGSLIRDSFYETSGGGGPIPSGPSADEEWFEWHSLASAISEARGRFEMVELGAGFGRWAVAGGVAARRAGLPFSLVCVEAEPSHFEMIAEHMRDNGIDPDAHRLIQAAVAATDGDTLFAIGNARKEWGQRMMASEDDGGFSSFARVPCASLGTVLQGIGSIDLIDMDIQGAEADVIESSLPLIRERVRRIHIGTHNHEVEARIRTAMRRIDFRLVWDFAADTTTETPVGRVYFQDGVQSWIRR